ncbi:MAG: hypothetical protein LUP95_01520 [Euryarchaeota archaeon]|nr:hypothetical protein [Euryarchaeota archaeon]
MHDIYVSEGELIFCFDRMPTTAHGVATFAMRQDETPTPTLEAPAMPRVTETFGSIHLDIHGNNEIIQKLRHGDQFTLMGAFKKRSAYDVNAWVIRGTISSVNLVKSRFTFEFMNGVSAQYAMGEFNFSQCPPR